LDLNAFMENSIARVRDHVASVASCAIVAVDMSEEIPVPTTRIISPAGIPSEEVVFSGTMYQTYPYAPEWFGDAVREAGSPGHPSRRREIVFSVCFAESYLFEWVLVDVLKRDIRALPTYFPVGRHRGVTEKWKEVPKLLHENGLIPSVPDLGGPHGEEWLKLVSFRDDLVHAATSRPHIATTSDPLSPASKLERLPPGWAVGVVVERVRLTHEATKTRVPDWLEQRR
jgi:hypothetical protein